MPSSNARALEKARDDPGRRGHLRPRGRRRARRQGGAPATRPAPPCGPGRTAGATLTIRCNGLDTPWGATTSGPPPRPPAATPSCCRRSAARAHLDAVVAVTGPDVRLWAMVETPAAVFAVREIAAHPQVDVLVVGTNDLAKELRAALVPGRAPLLPHLATIAARRPRGRRRRARRRLQRRARPRGLRGRVPAGRRARASTARRSCTPSQVEVANRVWAPTEAEVEHARRVIAAFERGRSARAGASSPSTAGWSRTCTSTTPAACSPSPRPSPPWADASTPRRGRAHRTAAVVRDCARLHVRRAARRMRAEARGSARGGDTARTYDGRRPRTPPTLAAGPCRRTSLTVALPTAEQLTAALSTVDRPGDPPAGHRARHGQERGRRPRRRRPRRHLPDRQRLPDEGHHHRARDRPRSARCPACSGSPSSSTS